MLPYIVKIWAWINPRNAKKKIDLAMAHDFLILPI